MSEEQFSSEEQISPELLEFLDATTVKEKIDVLRRIRGKLDDKLINSIAVSCDLVIREGDLDKRYEELMDCLNTKAKFEINRFR